MEKSGFILINLLPYREKQKVIKIQQFSLVIATFIVAALAINLSYAGIISAKVSYQEITNKFLNEENKKLKAEIKEIDNLKETIYDTLEKRNVVESLQTNRSDAVKILNSLSQELPDGTFITSVIRNGEKVNVVGQTQSNARVASYMLDLEKTSTFKTPELVEIKVIPIKTKKLGQDVTEQLSIFNFNVSLERENVEFKNIKTNKKDSKKDNSKDKKK